MKLFSLIGFNNVERIGPEIERLYPDAYRFVEPNVWFFTDDGTTRDVADKMGVSGGKLGVNALVSQVTNYTGYGPNGLWDWLRPRFRGSSDE